MEIARRFEAAGASMIHLSDGCFDSPWNTTAPFGRAQGFNMEYAAKIRRAIHIPLGVVGRINEPWVGELLLEQEACDAVYVGRALICDPGVPQQGPAGPGFHPSLHWLPAVPGLGQCGPALLLHRQSGGRARGSGRRPAARS